MPDHYSPKLFLQQIPTKLLREFFTRRGELGELDWDAMESQDADKVNVDPILGAWHALPGPQQAEIERCFRGISSLATKEGLRTVIEECQFHKLELQECLDQFQGIHEKIFWIYLNHEKVVTSAGRLNRADHLNARYWRLRNDLPAKQPDISHPTRRLLEQEISSYYKKHQGRGAFCTVEVYLRRENIHYFFAYPSDYADTAIVYDDGGALKRQCQQAAFEVIFAYNEATGVLDDFVQGDKKLRRDIEEIFCRLVLKEELPKEDHRRPPYDLDVLRKREFAFPTNPSDRIKETRIKLLRLSIAGPGFGRITFESDSWKNRGDIHDLIDKYLDQRQVAGVTLNVTQALLQVTFETDDGPMIVPFRITHPDSCNLRDEPEHLVIKEYLRRWGIATED